MGEKDTGAASSKGIPPAGVLSVTGEAPAKFFEHRRRPDLGILQGQGLAVGQALPEKSAVSGILG